MTYAYVRVSSESQARKDRDGIPRQKDAISKAATVDRWFVEPGKSGSDDITERPALLDLLEAVRPGDTVYVDRVDRLARHVGIQEYVLLKCRRRRVSLVSLGGEKTDSADPMETAIRQMFGVFAQLEAAIIQRRTANARAKKRAAWRAGTGPRCDGRKPYGEAKDPARRAEEARGLERIKTLRAEGRSWRDVAAALNAEQVPTRSGKPWIARTVWGIGKGSSNAAG